LQNYNQVSFGALLGACPEDLLNQVRVLFWKSNQKPPFEEFHGNILLAYSYMMPSEETVYKEILSLREKAASVKDLEITFLAGGSQATFLPEKAIAKGFDHVIAGEGEIAFPTFLQNWLSGRKNEKIIFVQPGSVNIDLFPGFHPSIGYLPPLEITRGCRFSCAFCSVPRLHRGIVRHRSIDSILKIAESYFKVKKNRRRIKFLSPNAFGYASEDGKQPNLQALQALLQALKASGVPEISLGSFPSEVRPEFVSREILEIVKPLISNRVIVVGVQTLNEDHLRMMNRGHTAEDARRAIALLREFGFTPHVDFMIGIPGETEEDQDRLLTFMEEMVQVYSIRIHMHTFMPLPGTLWGNSFASRISSSARFRLKNLQSKKVLDGWWENQIAYSRGKK